MLNSLKRSFWVYPVLLSLCLGLNNLTALAESSAATNTVLGEANALYEAGKTAVHNQNFKEAITKLNLLNLKYPYHSYQESVYAYLAYSLYNNKQYTEAIKATALFYEKYPESKKLKELFEQKENILQKPNKQEETASLVVSTIILGTISLVFLYAIFSFSQDKGNTDDKSNNIDTAKIFNNTSFPKEGSSALLKPNSAFERDKGFLPRRGNSSGTTFFTGGEGFGIRPVADISAGSSLPKFDSQKIIDGMKDWRFNSDKLLRRNPQKK